MAAFALFVACMVAWMSYSQARDRHSLETRGVRTEAVVLRIEHQDLNARHLWFEPRIASYPVFRFTTADGGAVEHRSTDMVDAARVLPGQLMTVVYDPANPRLARDAAGFDAEPGVTPWILGAFALLLAAGAVLFVVRPPPG
jgi:hypothetical protein